MRRIKKSTGSGKKKGTIMKIETKLLSKGVLARIVDHFRPIPLTDDVLAKVLCFEMCIEVKKIPGKQEKLEKKIKAMRVTFRSSQKRIDAYNKLTEQYNRIGNRGRSLLKSIEEIETEYPDLKKGDTT
jgi:hypothetical protein